MFIAAAVKCWDKEYPFRQQAGKNAFLNWVGTKVLKRGREIFSFLFWDKVKISLIVRACVSR